MVVVVKAQSSRDIVGHWKDNEENNRLTEFYQGDDGLYYAKIIEDKENKDINGKIFMKKLKYDDQSKTYKGVASPPDVDVNIEINATVSWIDKDTLLIVVKNFFKTKEVRFLRIK